MATRRKILFYTHALTGGGAERVWALLASGFARQGCEVIFACDYEAPENRDNLDPAVRLVILGGSHAHNVLRLAALIRRTRPDVTFSAIGVSNLKHGMAAMLAGRLSRAAQSYHGYYRSEPQFLSRLGYLLTPLSTRMFARTVTVSDGLDSYLKQRFHADPRRTVCVYNPVKWGAGAESVDVAAIAARDPVVLSAGRLVDYKNFAFLVRAFARVRRKDARLVILGEGPEKPAIEAEIARCGLAGRVTLAGYHADPWPFYEHARCFALASQSEAFGLVIVEAMAYGLPVVAADCEGPRQILDNGRYGALTPQGDEAAMAAALEAALDEPGDVAARRRRALDFSAQLGVTRYGAVIDDILRERRDAGDARARPPEPAREAN